MTATIHPFTERHTDERCERHGPFRARWLYVGDEWRDGGCPTCKDEAAEQQRRDDETLRRWQVLHKLTSNANVPQRFRDASFDGFAPPTAKARRVLAACRRYADDFPQRAAEGAGLILIGRPGTGKTMLSTAIIRKLIHQHERSAVYETAPGAVRRVRSTYSRDAAGTEDEVLAALIRPSLLILDEAGVGVATEHALGILQEIVDGRYRDGRPTLLVSNLNQRDLAAAVGERVMDRLAEGGQTLVFDWSSHRRRQRSAGESR